MNDFETVRGRLDPYGPEKQAFDRIEARVRDLQEDSNRLSECQAEVERLDRRWRKHIAEFYGPLCDENERLRADEEHAVQAFKQAEAEKERLRAAEKEATDALLVYARENERLRALVAEVERTNPSAVERAGQALEGTSE